MKKISSIAAALGLAFGIVGSANAATFVLSNDNGGDGYVVGIPGGFDLFGADNGVGSNTTSYLATALAPATFTFNWTYTINDVNGSYWDPAGYVVNSVYTQLSTNNDGSTPGVVDSSGTVTFSVLAGQNYGFYVYSVDSIFGRGDIAVTAVPEIDAASGTGAIGLLLGALALAGERRRKREVAAA